MPYKLYFLILTLLWSTSCSKQRDDSNYTASKPSTQLVIGCSQLGTRTSLGDNLTSTHWNVGDKIALWAQAEGESSFALDAQPFELHTYNSTYSSADFSSYVENSMPEGNYTYFAVYPLPTTQTGSSVSYTLPSEQSGRYDGTLDVMAAAPVQGCELANYALDSYVLKFRHLTHMLRLEVPTGRNLFGRNVRRLEIEFPIEVVGDLSFDAADSQSALIFENGSRKVTVDFDGQGLREEQAVYLFLRPCELMGTITFTAYDVNGFMSQSISTQIDAPLTMGPGRGTELTLTIPAARPVTFFDFKVTTNNLGEELTNIMVNAPEGTGFAAPFTPQSSTSVNLTPNADGIFRTGIYTDEYTLDMIQGKTIKLDMESESALLRERTLTLPAQMTGLTSVEVPVIVPYLFEEDFSGLTPSFEYNSQFASSDALNPDPKALDDNGLPGWTGVRNGGGAGQSIRICSRVEVGFWVVNARPGRLDTPPMSSIKANKTPNVRITYDYAGDRYNKTGGKNGDPVLTLAHTTKQGLISAGDGVDQTLFSGKKIGINGSQDQSTLYHLSSFPSSESQTIAACTSTTRITWFLNNNRAGAIAANGNYWIYLDNIKVSISK